MGKGEPAIYYPTGERSFIRLMAREDLQGVANAMLAKQLGLRRVYVLQDPGFKAEQSDPFRRTARRLGIQTRGRGELQRRTPTPIAWPSGWPAPGRRACSSPVWDRWAAAGR